MDSLDIGIIREMITDPSNLTIQFDIRRPYQEIARRLQTSEDTVRNRIKTLESGLIRSWKVGINPTLFGYLSTFIFFDVRPPNSKRRMFQELRSFPGVMWLVDFLGDFLGCMLAYRDGGSLKSKIGYISELARSENIVPADAPFPKCSSRLTENDWRIVRTVQRKPRSSYSDIAKRIGLSTRTVRRRLGTMISENALFVFPELDFDELEGGVLLSLAVFYDTNSKRTVDNEILSRFQEWLILAHLTDSKHGWYNFIIPNLSKFEAIRTAVEGMPGVTSVSARPVIGLINLVDRVFQKDML